MTTNTRLQICCILLIYVWLIGILLYRIDSQPLVRWDELTNYSVVTESMNSGNPLILILQSEPFFEKPPLWYYITGILVQFFGPTNTTLRVVSVISGIFVGFLIFILASFNTSFWTGIISLILFSTIPHLYVTNAGGFFSTHTLRSADVDSLQIFLIMLASYLFLLADKCKLLVYIGAACSALAFLTKGPLGLVPYGIYIIMKFSKYRKIEIQELLLSAFMIIGIISAWVIPMIMIFKGEFLQQFIGYHLFSRFTAAIEGHTQHIMYPVILLATPKVFPFFLPLTLSCIFQIVCKNMYKDTITQYCFLSLVTILIINIFTQTKLAWYLLPFYPFAVIFIARTIYHVMKNFSGQY